MVAPAENFFYNEWHDPYAMCLSVDYYSLEIYLDENGKVLEPYYPEDYNGYEEEPVTWEQESPEAEVVAGDQVETKEKATTPKATTPPAVVTPPLMPRMDGSGGQPVPDKSPRSSPKLTAIDLPPPTPKEQQPDSSPTMDQKRVKSLGDAKLELLRAKIAELKLKKEKEAQKEQTAKNKKENSNSSSKVNSAAVLESATLRRQHSESQIATSAVPESSGKKQKESSAVKRQRSGEGKRPSPVQRSRSPTPKQRSPKRPRTETTLLPKRRSALTSPRDLKDDVVLKRHRSDPPSDLKSQASSAGPEKSPKVSSLQAAQIQEPSPRVQLRAAGRPAQQEPQDLLRRVLRGRAATSPQDMLRRHLLTSQSRRV